MFDIYVLNKNLENVGVIDNYKSLIWANRYNDIGDCELYVEASTSIFNLLKKDYYLIRTDDEMVCQIKKIQLATDTENGDYLIVGGKDVKSFLDQRIVWNTMVCNGNLEEFMLEMVDKSLINPILNTRKLLKPNGEALLSLDAPNNFTKVNTEQISYKNVGVKTREYCKANNWGYKVVLDNKILRYKIYSGNDRSSNVIFSDNFENLATTNYTEDYSNLGNVGLIAGEGEGSDRIRNVSGNASGVDRYEIFIDAKDISKTITFEELVNMYPLTSDDGEGYIDEIEEKYVYKLNSLNIEIIDSAQLEKLKSEYPDGQEIIIDENNYYQIYDVIIAILPNEEPLNDDNVELCDIIYQIYLLNRGYEKLSEYGTVVSFEGTVEPNVTFKYKKDYFLGDVVTVQNEYGITVNARITEVVEVNDDNGYSVEPKFEYLEVI